MERKIETKYKKIGDEFSDNIEKEMAIIVKNKLIGVDEIISKFDDLEKYWVSKISENTYITDHFRKLIAERRVVLILKRGITVEYGTSLFDQINFTGFVDLYSKTTVYISFARFFVSRNRKKLARNMLQNLYGEINANQRVSKRMDYQESMKNIEAFLKSMSSIEQ